MTTSRARLPRALNEHASGGADCVFNEEMMGDGGQCGALRHTVLSEIRNFQVATL